MRLLKFKNGNGLGLYEDFLGSYLPLLHDLGGEFLFLGSATPYEMNYESSHELFGLKQNPWDLVAFERFRSRKDLRRLRDSEDYLEAEADLHGHLKGIAVHALNGTLYWSNGRSKAETMVSPEYPDGDELFELNLLRFKPNGGEERYHSDYAKEVMPMIGAGDASVIFGLTAELMLLGEEQYDRAILVMYPSEKIFHQIVLSEKYQAISHLREDALEVGHLFGFKNEGKVLKRLRKSR